MMAMTREDFEDLVADALDSLEPEVVAALDNVIFVVEDDAPAEEPDLLGRYEGIPLTERDGFGEMGMLPDRIVIYRNPTLQMCATTDEVAEEVRVTVRHEIGHYFGIDDDRLDELGWA